MSIRMPGNGIVFQNTTANLTLVPLDMGKAFTNVGATAAITYTLPAPTAIADNANWVKFFSCTTLGIVITTPTTGQMIGLNDITATSIAFTTATKESGGGITMYSNGTKWMYEACGASGQTATIGD